MKCILPPMKSLPRPYSEWRAELCPGTVVLSCLLMIPVALAHADGEPPRETTPVGSAAQFDQRLPPVLPGEVVGKGKNRMKVWSTSGSPSVSDAPVPSSPGTQGGEWNIPPNVDILVDPRAEVHPRAPERLRDLPR